jgi:hypothetical protein
MEGPHGKIREDKGPDFLSCGCSVDSAILELWMTKVTANDINVPKRTDEGMTPARMAFSPDNLQMVESAILAASGLTPAQLLQTEEKRLDFTIRWAMGRLGQLYEEHHDQPTITYNTEQLNKYLDELAEAYTH